MATESNAIFNAYKNLHEGETIWVIASGASMDYIEPGFFDDKVTIGVNEVYRKFKCDYLVRKELAGSREAVKNGRVFVSQWDCGMIGGQRNNTPGAVVYDHENNKLTDIDFPEDGLVVSYSTITTAMHLAAYMGASTIILCGHDCGTLDGRSAMRGYHEDHADAWGGDESQYREWLKVIEPQTLQVKFWLKKEYGCEVYSLNPFINFGLEGHRYEP